jgi:LysM domain
MGSLTAHLLEPGDHGRLRFHPSCPVCRQQRLYGTLSSEPVVSRRAQALLAGGVLAISSSAPTLAVAQEADRQFEGVAAPGELGSPDVDDPAFDPGGDTELSFDTAPAPAAPEGGDDSGDGAPLDVEPTVDLDARLAPLAEPDDAVGQETAIPPTEAVSPDAAVPPGVAPGAVIPPGVSAQPGGPGSPGDPPASPEGHLVPGKLRVQDGQPRADSPRTHLPTPARSTYEDVRRDASPPASSQQVGDGAEAPPETLAPSAPEPIQADATVVAAPPPEPAAAETDGMAEPTPNEPPRSGDPRSYVVQPGDSLWSIAKRLLGPDASAGLVAREVHRLWSLNRSRIATGDPDLLMVGTRLELR